MGKQSRIKKEKESKRKADIKRNEEKEAKRKLAERSELREEVRAHSEQLVRHLQRIDPEFNETVDWAVKVRKERGDKDITTGDILLVCQNLLNRAYVPTKICVECGVDCFFQKSPPEPPPRLIIESDETFIRIRLTKTPKLAVHGGLNQCTLRLILSGESLDCDSHIDERCVQKAKKIVDDIHDVVSNVVAEIIRKYGTANLSNYQTRKLKVKLALELNQNYDLGIQTHRDKEDSIFSHVATTVLSFRRDGQRVVGARYDRVASLNQEICAFCMYLPCECSADDSDE